MTVFRRPAALLLSASLLPAPLYAAGDAPRNAAGRNPAAPPALFEEAQRGVASGDYEQACPKFKASYELDPAGGTLLNLADCLEKQGRIASAWSAFKDALVVAQRDGRNERVEYAQQHIRTLEAKLSYLTVEVPASSSVGQLSIEVDGTPLAAAAWGTALPVDPGEHVLHAEAPGFEPLDQKLTIGGAGARDVFTLPALRASRSEAAAGATIDAQSVMAEEPRRPARTWAWITGGVGLAALGVGSYFGVKAFADWDDRNAACAGGCTRAARAAGEDANQAATNATIGVSAGVVLLGAATVLFFYSSGADPGADVETGLSITPMDRGASISWGGQF
jgi:tetratricopeptide (TPR) repeat protein